MEGIYRYLYDEHRKMDALLSDATGREDVIEMNSYGEFRKVLLRHIGIEEKIILPAITRLQNGKQFEMAQKIRLDHGALVALLVPTPTLEIIETIRLILESHNSIEESDRGLYHLIEDLAGEESDGVLEKVKAYPEVPTLPHKDMPGILDVTRRAVERAGYKATF